MHASFTRRRLLQSAMALGSLPVIASARAAEGGVVLGYAVHASSMPMLNAVMLVLHESYRPDLGLTVTIKAGNTGAVALETVHNSPADGGTVLMAASSTMALMPHLRQLPTVDPVRDFIPVAAIAEFGDALIVGPTVPSEVRNFAEFLAWSRKNIMHLDYGVPGMGTAGHFFGESMARSSGIGFKPIAYKSLVSAVGDVQSGHIASAIVPIVTANYAIRDPQVRMLAMTSDTRWPGFPQVPTMIELGMTDIAVVESLGLFLPVGTPAAKVQELRNAVHLAARSEPVLAQLAALQLRPIAANPPDYAASLVKERETWAGVVKKNHISLTS